MKRKMILMAVACLLLSAVAAFAQTKTDFSGEWTLDVGKSKLPEMMRIEGGTMKVVQTDKDIAVTTDLKRAPRPDGAGGQGQGPGGGRGMGGFGAGNGTMTYMLDGKETTVDMPGPQGATMPVKLESKWDGGKLKLSSKRTFSGQNGEMTITTKETWESVDGGKGLKVIRETETPRGQQSAEFYYAKK